MEKKRSAFILIFTIAWGCYLLFSAQLYAQEKTYVQIKVFDQNLKPVPNLNLTINEEEEVFIDDKGTAFTELDENNLPPKTVKITALKLEAESWNYSKGTLEIIVREKKYQVHTFVLKDSKNKPIPHAKVTYRGPTEIVRTSDGNGMLEVPLPIETTFVNKHQFAIPGYKIDRVVFTEKEKTIIVNAITASKSQINDKDHDDILDETYFKNFDLSHLDSIQSLTVFYAVFKNYQIGDLDEELKQKVDAKFNELIGRLYDSTHFERKLIIGKISDSSFVNDDLKDLLDQALSENAMLDQLMEEFDEKIKLITEKLNQGSHELDEEAQESLLADINSLEMILEENEKKFYRNQMDYRTILSSFKNRLLNVKDLERKLYVSETQRILEKEYFRRQILIVSLFTAIFALLATLLYYFSKKLRTQQKALILAHKEVKKVNENLEHIVGERTKSLLSVNKEMDTFLYKASHNLRRPICSIMGLANLALQSKTEEAGELFEKVSHTAKEMDGILGKLLVINEINHPESYSAINLKASVDNLKETYKNILKEKNISLNTDVKTDLWIHSYPQLLQFILTNLMDNAIFYTTLKGEGKPEIRISVMEKEDNVELTFFDNGTGIDSNVKEYIWNMFFIGDDRSKGNGLGLYIVLKSAQAIGGSISVESVKNEYTQFKIQLPVRSAG